VNCAFDSTASANLVIDDCVIGPLSHRAIDFGPQNDSMRR
jgi:hypothetical protein